ncbi:MAG: chromosome segregation protein SMC [Chloroflexi bacterium]|nr:chromosome segregation protein SMC [Chloroflexota bacterium]
MYLRRLEVHGFKAFADRQRFEFGPGMTVVAGPNGSGKSNVADAIRWALGEQSQKQVRARKTEDVIFSGSDKRRQMGMAEVTLLLDNSEGWMPIDFSEVSVTRRAHRSGENEYLINGQQVRLADVLDLFRRAQVGQNSYAHMSQGLVDEVLALKPQDRRALIEEAADLRRHRHQLTLSERRMVETRDNLGHVRMLIREVEPRIRALQRQSKRAARYQELARELSDALEVYFESELRSAREAQTAAQAQHDQQGTAFAEARDSHAKIEARLGELNTVLAGRRGELEVLQRRERELAEEGLRLEQAVALAQQRIELLAERRTELEAAIAQADVPDDDTGSFDALLTALDARVAQEQARLERERTAMSSADEATRTVLRELAEAEARRARLEAERDDLQRRIVEEQARRQRRAAEVTEARAAIEALQVEAVEQRRLLAAHEQEADARATAARMTRERREAAERRLDEARRDLESARAALREAEDRAKMLRERQALIERLQESLPSATGGAHALIEAKAQPAPDGDEHPLSGVIDAVARLIRVPDGLEAAIEAALAEHLSAVVVEKYEDAVAALAYLREEGAGTATVYPLQKMEHRYPINLFNERGVIGIAARLVRCEQKFRPLVDTLLGRVIVVEDMRVAEQMITRGLGSVVTKDGTLLRPGGALYGGRAGGMSERFSIQRELEGLPAQVEAAEVAVAPARARVEQAIAQVDQAQEAMAAARGLVDEAEEARRQQAGERAALERRQAEIDSELRSLARRLEEDPADASRQDELAQRLESAAATVAEVAGQIVVLRDRSTAVGTERDEVAERVTAATHGVAGVEAERRALVAQRDERTAARAQAIAQLQERRGQLEQIRREQEDLELTLRDRRERQANFRTERTDVQGRIGPAHAAVAELSGEEHELAASRGDAQRLLLAAERELLESENRLRRAVERVQSLDREITEEGMEVMPDDAVKLLPKAESPAPPRAEGDDFDEGEDGDEAGLVASMPVRGAAEVDVAALRERITDLRAEIRALGPVNVEALEDLGAEQERFDFLTTQVADLEAAEAELREAVRDLKKLIRERFVETFHVVNERFGMYFTRFFGGGQAELRLLEPDAEDGDSEPGVDIFAQPPGKRISNMAVLSGGERSMTSVALLFALLSVNPAPMVVLDEVDAALDEANVARFVDTLLELRDRTQFVVISHNRRTIEAGDAIYGISMGDDSTSQVLSLRLADLPRAS